MSAPCPMRLENRFITARFSPDTGNLVYLSAAGGRENMLERSFCRYFANGAWTSDFPEEPGSMRFEASRAQGSDRLVELVARSEALEIRKRYELDPASPLLKVTHAARGLRAGRALRHVAFPRVEFAATFADAFEDERDLFNDGAELGGGFELPCWRVFFREGQPDGLIVATRSKLDMSRFQIFERGFDIRPHAMPNYDTAILNPVMTFEERRTYTARFEIGPWSEEKHAAIMRAARLTEPIRVDSPAPAGTAAQNLPGIIFDAVDFAAPDAVSGAFRRDRWMAVDAPFSRKGRMLVAGPDARPPALVLDPGLKGIYRIFAGLGSGDGIAIGLSGEGEPVLRRGGRDQTPFHLRLSGRHEPVEVFFRAAEMDGKKIELGRFPNPYATTAADYVRFEPLTGAALAEWRRRQNYRPALPISGFHDIPDIAAFTDMRDPDPAAYRANLREHARCEIRKVYWRIDGQCSDYPSKVNTMRYVSAKIHGVFTPRAKAYGRALQKTDMLALAVDEARRSDLELYGWMRFNNYTGNVQSAFFRNHPEYWEEWETGFKGGKLCLAHPEVRRHKIAILVEAAAYGLAGLSLGFLRHPPVLHYAPILVEGYRRKYGMLPPRDPAAADQNRLRSFPETDPAHVRWFQYRADFLTLFGRELRAALGQGGQKQVKISIWVRPNHCLFDGIDLPAWLGEGLCDEVVADDITGRAHGAASPAWKRMVQAKVPLIRGISALDAGHARRVLPEIAAGGYDGVSVYESDYAVYDPALIELLASLKK